MKKRILICTVAASLTIEVATHPFQDPHTHSDNMYEKYEMKKLSQYNINFPVNRIESAEQEVILATEGFID